jgi:post-segregation antitoxin (ccd killing protein)
LPNDAKEIQIRLIMRSEALIAHVPPRIATLVKARARDRQLSTSRFLTRLIEKEVEPEKEDYTAEQLWREVAEAEAKAGELKTYTSAKELIHDLQEYAKHANVHA